MPLVRILSPTKQCSLDEKKDAGHVTLFRQHACSPIQFGICILSLDNRRLRLRLCVPFDYIQVLSLRYCELVVEDVAVLCNL
jgi:hypothetical protein